MAVGIVGMVAGILVALATENEPNSCNYIILMSNGGYSIFGKFLKQLLITLVLFALVFVAIFHRYLRCLGYIVLFFIGYQFGGSMVVAITENSALGAIFVIIYVIPINIMIIALISVMICCVANYLNTHGQYRRCSVLCRGNVKILAVKFAYCALVVVIMLTLFMVIIPSIAQAIIVV